MTEAQVNYMVNRFLSWKLPEHFNPDGGITFTPIGSRGTPHEFRREPVGTNLLDATQAEAMVRHMIDGMPEEDRVLMFSDALRVIFSTVVDPEGMSADNQLDLIRHRAGVALGLENADA